MIINVMCCHVCLKTRNISGYILDSYTWSQSEIGGNVPDEQKMSENSREGFWDFKHFLIGQACRERSRLSLVSLVQIIRPRAKTSFSVNSCKVGCDFPMVIWSKFHMAHVTWGSIETTTIGRMHRTLEHIWLFLRIRVQY